MYTFQPGAVKGLMNIGDNDNSDGDVEDGDRDVASRVVCLRCNSTGNWALTDVSIIFLWVFRLCWACPLFYPKNLSNHDWLVLDFYMAVCFVLLSSFS